MTSAIRKLIATNKRTKALKRQQNLAKMMPSWLLPYISEGVKFDPKYLTKTGYHDPKNKIEVFCSWMMEDARIKINRELASRPHTPDLGNEGYTEADEYYDEDY
jgi:hypothetical protein